jgi:hypothetical protein
MERAVSQHGRQPQPVLVMHFGNMMTDTEGGWKLLEPGLVPT